MKMNCFTEFVNNKEFNKRGLNFSHYFFTAVTEDKTFQELLPLLHLLTINSFNKDWEGADANSLTRQYVKTKGSQVYQPCLGNQI